MNGDEEDAPDSKFNLRSISGEFQNRQSGIFDQLNALEHQHVISRSEWKEEAEIAAAANDASSGESEATSRGIVLANVEISNSSPFKIPTGIPPKRTAPDFKVHPEKWTKYSLDDVDEESMSEAGNARIAQDFFKSRWKSDSDYEENQTDCSTTVSNDLTHKRFSMPEYVVGASSSNNKMKRKSRDVENNCESGGAETNANGPLSFVDKPNSDESEIAVNDDTSIDDNPQFRSVRKRQRNVRKVKSDEQD